MMLAAGEAHADPSPPCEELRAIGDVVDLEPVDVASPDQFAVAGCVDFGSTAQQGPTEWYVGRFRLTATVTGPSKEGDAADLLVRVGNAAVVIASLTRMGSDLELTSPTVGSEFSRRLFPASDEPITIDFEIDNYLQAASFEADRASVDVGFREYGLDIDRFELAAGTLALTSEPPFDVVLSIGQVSGGSIEAVVSLRDAAAFDDRLSIAISEAPGSDVTTDVEPAQLAAPNPNSRTFLIPNPCDSDCTVDLLARVDAESAGGRFAFTEAGTHRSSLSYFLVVAGTASICTAAWQLAGAGDRRRTSDRRRSV